MHGGAWTSGDRFGNVAIDTALAEAGAVVLALDFRMPPEAGYPAAVEDVASGIRWMKEHAAELHTRPDLVGGLGTSSGAQTVLLCALREPVFSFVVACWPIANPLARYRMAKEKGNKKLVAAHDAYWRTEAAMTEGNPQLILERGEAIVPLPPLLVIQGTNDDNVTPTMADDFVSAYRGRGGSAELHKFEGQPHSFIKEPVGPAGLQALEYIKTFVLKQGSRVQA